MKKMFVIFFILSLSFSCATNSQNKEGEQCLIQKHVLISEYKLQACLYMQHSGEFRALSYQAYQLGTMRLKEILAQRSGMEQKEKIQTQPSIEQNSTAEPKANDGADVNSAVKDESATVTKPLAVILDIDETVLDNTPYLTYEVFNNSTFNDGSWHKWVMKAEAKLLPGAKEFFEFAQSQKVEIFLISNRSTNELDATFENLVREGLQVKKENFLFKENESSKKNRRDIVAQKFDVALFFGDNLSDFHEKFEVKQVKDNSDRNHLVDQEKGLFGNKFIVFPNPNYGDWVRALPQAPDGPIDEVMKFRRNLMIQMKE